MPHPTKTVHHATEDPLLYPTKAVHHATEDSLLYPTKAVHRVAEDLADALLEAVKLNENLVVRETAILVTWKSVCMLSTYLLHFAYAK